MAQTKRKKRGKHRGNAIGMVESKGRAGSKPTAPRQSAGAPGKGGARKPVPLKPPSWQSAAIKAGFGCAILFVFFMLVGKDTSIGSALGFAAFAFVLYTPIMFYTDRFIYNRKTQGKKKT